MLSKNRIKFIKALHQKKYRTQEGLFIVERAKIVIELLASDWVVDSLYATQEWYESNSEYWNKMEGISIVNSKDLKAISLLKTAPEVVAIVKIPLQQKTTFNADNWCLYLDGIQDPSNLGAVLRIADWFGIEYVFHSFDTVEVYNPKVVQASMGSFLRVKMQAIPLADLKRETNLETFGAFMKGEDVFQMALPENGILVIGNEGKGIRNENHSAIDTKINIPKKGKAESLNAAVATGILCAQINRNAPIR